MINCENENENNLDVCIGCVQSVTDCKCIWGLHREIYRMLSDLFSKVDKHWDLLYQADENLSKRINDTLKESVKMFSDLEKYMIKNHIDHDERIHNIEKWKKSINDDYVEFKMGYSTLKEIWIEQNVRNIHERIDVLETEINKSHTKKPHECPVCDGEGKCRRCRGTGEYFTGNSPGQTAICEFCHGKTLRKPCEGKGIIWG